MVSGVFVYVSGVSVCSSLNSVWGAPHLGHLPSGVMYL